MLALLSLAFAAEPSWDATLDRVTRAVVAIQMDKPRAFDGSAAGNSQATGFVIAPGWILTNRHVVTPGPVTAHAVFYDKEEVDLVPVYRDPVHDFGLYRYDPAEVEHMVPPVLPLSPERARVGLSIRVVGNDGGDQLQILDGTLARLDRDAPSYGPDFNDFNTFYIQAASATSGGSSGSPVVDVDGNVVAINAGGSSRTAGSYYLPLHRVVRAVELLKNGEAVPRGTMQTRVVYETFDEIERLGVSPKVLAEARAARPEGTGLLVVREVLPGGPAHEKLHIGDVVLEVDGVRVHDHVTLEGSLDDHVGKPIRLKVARAGEVLEVEVTPGDLHAITPDRLLEVGEAVLHPLSYHQARVMQTAVRGIYVADPGYLFQRAGVPPHAVILELDGQPVSTLEDFSERLAAMPHGQTFRVRHYRRGRPQETFLATATMDRRWFDQRLCVRDDASGTWPCTTVAGAEGEAPLPTVDVPPTPTDDKRVARILPSLVELQVTVPVQVAGVPSTQYNGSALVVGEGLAITDRDTVPDTLADITVVLGGVARLPAQVAALHPIHNLAVIRFDAERARAAGVRPALLRDTFEVGDEAIYVAVDEDGPTRRDVSVTDTVPLDLSDAGTPRFRQTQLEQLWLNPWPPHTPGVMVDKQGRVGALWSSFSYNEGRDVKAEWAAMPMGPVRDAIALATGGTNARALPWELRSLPLTEAVKGGLAPEEATKLVDATPDHRYALLVYRTVPGTPAAEALRPGDLLLAVAGAPVTRFADVEEALRGRDQVSLTLWRDGARAEVTVDTEPLDPFEVDRVVLWSGVRVHTAHRAARMQGLPACPYVSFRQGGSPAGRAGIYAWRCIVALDGTPTPDLDALLAVDARLKDRQHVRVDLVTLEGRREVRTIQLDRAFWPTEELVHDGTDWSRTAR